MAFSDPSGRSISRAGAAGVSLRSIAFLQNLGFNASVRLAIQYQVIQNLAFRYPLTALGTSAVGGGIVDFVLPEGWDSGNPLGSTVAAPSRATRELRAELAEEISGTITRYFRRNSAGQLIGPDGRFVSDPARISPSLNRPGLRSDTRRAIEESALRNDQGDFINENGEILANWHYGHISGHENRRILIAADEVGLNQAQLK